MLRPDCPGVTLDLAAPPWLRFVVVGSGRSGTAYAAAVFCRLGIPCGHEAVFGWGHPPDPRLLGDSSFCAAPFLGWFSGVVFHQVRHPLAVLQSVVATGFFHDPGPYVPHLALVERFLPDLGRATTPIEKAIRFVLGWNLMCEPHAHLRWQVETLAPSTLRAAARLLGEERSLDQCADALAAVPTDLNRLETRGLRRVVLGWEDLPAAGSTDDLVALAKRYGYDP